MVDRSFTYLKGIVEAVLVKVDKFIFPIDFVVLNMEEVMSILYTHFILMFCLYF